MGPAIRQGQDRTRCSDLLGGMQTIEKHLALQFAVSNAPERESERMLDKQGPRGFHLLRDFTYQSERDCRETSLIEYSLEQSHGLLADRSSRNQENQVNAVFLELPRYFRAGLIEQRAHDRDVSHKGEVPPV